MGKYAEYDYKPYKNKPTKEQIKQEYSTNLKNSIRKSWLHAGQTRDFKEFCSFIKTFSDFEGIKQEIFFDYERWTEPQKMFEESRSKFDIVLKPRRIGFTTMELIRDLFYALTVPGSTTLIVAQEEDLAERTMITIKGMIEGLEELGEKIGLKLIPERRLWSSLEISFSTGSSIRCFFAKAKKSSAAKGIRGISVSRLHCTEVAFWEYTDLTMTAVMNAALHADEIVIESTAHGNAGWFYDFYWKVANGEAGDKWKSHFYPWHCIKTYQKELTKVDIEGDPLRFIEPLTLTPKNQYEETLINEYHINLNQLKWWRETVARSKLEQIVQEFPINEETCFLSKSETFLDQKDFIWLYQNIKPEIKTRQYNNCPLETPVKIWKVPESSYSYIIGVDVSWGKGEGKDFSSFYVIDKHTGEICASFSSNKIDPGDLAELLVEVGNDYNKALLAVESNGPGNQTITKLQRLDYYNLYSQGNSVGFFTSQTSRNALFGSYQLLISEKTIPIVDQDLVNESKTLVIKDNRIDHIRGAFSDRTIAFLIAQKAREDNTGFYDGLPLFHSGDGNYSNHNIPRLQNTFKLGRPRFN